MNIVSSDLKCSISIGGVDTCQTLCSTVRCYLSQRRDELLHAFYLLENAHVPNQECLAAAREFNLIRDALSQIPPNGVIYDDMHPDKLSPWGDNISPVITSCANYLTDGSGNDLLAEIVKILTYAAYAKADVDVM